MNYEQDHSHSHCWESQNPPCGHKGKHLKCCLCLKYVPQIIQGYNAIVDVDSDESGASYIG